LGRVGLDRVTHNGPTANSVCDGQTVADIGAVPNREWRQCTTRSGDVLSEMIVYCRNCSCAELQLSFIATHFLRPGKDERLSWPSRLTCSGRFTDISGRPSAAGRAQDRESSPVRCRRFIQNCSGRFRSQRGRPVVKLAAAQPHAHRTQYSVYHR